MRLANKSFQSCLILLALFAFSATTMWSQTETTTKKKVVIIKKTIDSEGNETIEKIVKEGDDVNEYLENEDIEINVNTNDGQGMIRITNSDGSEEVIDLEDMKLNNSGEGSMRIIMNNDGEDFEWNGSEMDEEIMDKLEEMDIDIDVQNFDGNRMIMINDEDVDRPMLGVHIEDAGNNGALITNVVKGSAAAKAGLVEGDIITKINRTKVTSPETLISALSSSKNGDKVKVRYLRDGKKKRTKATLTSLERDQVMSRGASGCSKSKRSCCVKKGSAGNIQKNTKKVIVIEKSDGQSNVITEDVIVTSPSVGLSELEIYPNPAQGKVNILFTANAVPTTVKVLDLNGATLFEERIENFDGRYVNEVDLGNGHTGGVMLQIVQGDEIFSEKILNN